ncbi:peptidase inhibitor family I36 protein [Streptomyces johnsoniae]|uniref:Peptidase inhibitor family I36 protein n=1 Tax=Streptomyces johnsoniae TaxID=3075532 RepID=A0ABU2SBS0_9ACTN|nr:peptidase inhibitor family I36 protein [Streptomyces sp. DSM 41886]MDT0446347.1 peptidase inhibitor family I36 protein [Streptomyces sp. DSM 41886]
MIRKLTAALALAAALALTNPAHSHAAPAAPDISETDLARAAAACTSGWVCFWSGHNFSGSKCQWDVADRDWLGGAARCSWSKGTAVKSVFNAGVSGGLTGVAYYTGVDYTNRIGCTPQGLGGNLAGTYTVRSHRWINTSCG